MDLEVGRLEPGSRAEEGARLRDVRGQRPLALLEEREALGRERVEERRTVGLVVHRGHRVVLQVVTDGQVLADLDPEEREILGRPDAGEHQQDGRLVGARGEDHLALGPDHLDVAVPGDLDADGPRAPRTGSAAQMRR